MRLERAGLNQVKIIVTFEELESHGLSKEEIGKDNTKWNYLLSEIINQAKEEFDIYFNDTFIIDIFSFHSKELVFVITNLESDELYPEWEDIIYQRGQRENAGLFKFREMEDIIQLAHRIDQQFEEGQLLYFNNAYYLNFPTRDLSLDKFESLLLEYGDRAKISFHFLKEYGDTIIENNALKIIRKYFSKTL